jgi:7 transmembrane receptor (rhodopsin family)
MIVLQDPLRYGRWVTRRVVCTLIAAVWLLAALISFVPISFNLHRPPLSEIAPVTADGLPTCALDLTPTYAIVSSCISFIVPCVVMVLTKKHYSFPPSFDLCNSKNFLFWVDELNHTFCTNYKN